MNGGGEIGHYKNFSTSLFQIRGFSLKCSCLEASTEIFLTELSS